MPAERKAIRAFEHLTNAFHRLARKCPAAQVGGIIGQQLPAFFPARSHHRAIPAGHGKQLGIAKVHRRRALGQISRADHGVFRPLAQGEATVAFGDALLLRRAFAIRRAGNAGVHQIELALLLERRAGKAAQRVERRVRRQHVAVPLPAQKVVRSPVPPVHGAPYGIIGMVLAIQVILPLIMDKSVGIVDPAHRRAGVVQGSELFVRPGGVLRHIFVGVLQCHGKKHLPR